MARQLAELYRQPYCVKLIEAALQGVVGKPWKKVFEDALYREYVIDPAWDSLPAPIRMFGRPRLRWDEFFLALRKEVFDSRQDRVALRPDRKEKLGPLAVWLFGNQEVSPETVGQPQSTPPPDRAIPLARPVAAPATPAPTDGAAPAATAAVGIDLGTTYSVVACLDAHGRPYSIANAAGDVLTPSVVL